MRTPKDPPPVEPELAADLELDDNAVRARIDDLVTQLRDLRAAGRPGMSFSPDRQRTVADLDTELDRLWGLLRRRRVPPRGAVLPRVGTGRR